MPPPRHPQNAESSVHRRLIHQTLLVTLSLTMAAVAAIPQRAEAKAPPLAIVAIDAGLRQTPDPDSPEIGHVPACTQVELTGRAAPSFIEVIVRGTTGWLPAEDLEVSNRVGIETATATEDLALTDAPAADGRVLGKVPKGGTVILTGAQRDGFVAVSYDGLGGWADAAGLNASPSPRSGTAGGGGATGTPQTGPICHTGMAQAS